MRILKIFLAAMFSLALASSSDAGLILQDTSDAGCTIQIFEPIGQTFTAEDARINSIGFFIHDSNPFNNPDDHDLTVRLYEGGSGSTGSLIGEATVATIPDGNYGYVDFDFNSVVLSVGQVYSAMLDDDTYRWGVSYQGQGNPYTYGAMIDHGYGGNADIQFRVVPPGWPPPKLYWTQVNFGRFGDANNEDIEMIVYGNFLYAATENELTGAEVWRYDGGTSWTQVNTDGFGDEKNCECADLIVFNDTFYVATRNAVTGVLVWRYGGGTSWTRVDPGAGGPGNGGFGDNNNIEASLYIYNNTLYASTENDNTGTEVWRYDGGTSWTRVDTDILGPGNGGFGDTNNIESGLLEYDGTLYAATKNINTGAEVWRYDGGTSWTQVNTDGFGDEKENAGVEEYAIYNGFFYVGTYNQITTGEVWRYDGGTSWTDVTPPWDGYNKAAIDLIAHNNNLYVATENTYTGGEVWKYDETTWTQVNTDGFGDISNEEIEFIIYNNARYACTGDEVWRLSCEGDFDGDGDVDGSDLADFAVGTATISLKEFAIDFGRTEAQ